MRYQAIYNTHPTVNAIYDEIDAYDKDGNKVELNEAVIATEITRLQAEYDAKQYQRDRAKEYPDFKDYLDGIVKGDTAQVQAYIDACNAIKQKYPKGA
jgi:hypothetical protein